MSLLGIPLFAGHQKPEPADRQETRREEAPEDDRHVKPDRLLMIERVEKPKDIVLPQEVAGELGQPEADGDVPRQARRQEDSREDTDPAPADATGRPG